MNPETETITKRFETCAEVRAWYAKHFYGMPVYEHGVEMTCASHGISYSPSEPPLVCLIDAELEAAEPAKRAMKFPNLALMKLSAWLKQQGATIKLGYDPLFDHPAKCYVSKVFTWTPDPIIPVDNCEVNRGGTGYDMKVTLADEAEKICPDYSLYGRDYSMGFLTRGCIRKCPWCFVPEKEGQIRPAADIEDFLRHGKAVLLDNNVLACDHGIKQIEKLGTMDVKVDFNQGLDARLIDDSVAKLLSKVKWLEPVRLACDTAEMMPIIQRAVELMRWRNVRPTRYSCYVLLTDDIEDGLKRISFLKGIYVDPFVQPYITRDGKPPSVEQSRLARYVDMKSTFKSAWWEEYTA